MSPASLNSPSTSKAKKSDLFTLIENMKSKNSVEAVIDISSDDE